MPITVNGIGTRYYGKSNAVSELGVCEFCKKGGRLESYDTTLWFAVFFIPVIPLGRKRILALCPSCRKHRVLGLKEWNLRAQEAISAQIQKMQSNPDDPRNALALHEALTGFGRMQEAEKLTAVMTERFPNDADAQLYLGIWHSRFGRAAEAAPYFEHALALRPEDLSVRRAAAAAAIERGDLDRARGLTTAPPEAGPHNEANLLLALGKAYHSAGRDAEALEIYGLIRQREGEAAARDKALRKAIRRSERAIRRANSRFVRLLPRPRTALLVGVPLLLAVGALCANFILMASQTLHIVNGLPIPATVTIPGMEPVRVHQSGHTTVTLSEGKYRATIAATGVPNEETAIDIRNSLWARFTRDRSFILNVCASAVFLRQEVVYSAHRGVPPTVPHTLLIGDRFFVQTGLDYVLTQPPASLPLEGKKAVHKLCLTALTLPARELLPYLQVEHVPADRVLTWAEAQLRAAPADQELLFGYVQAAGAAGATDRCLAYLAKALPIRPVLVEWHRAYQTLRIAAGNESALAAEYGAMLEADPANADLLYLRGRICRGSEAMSYYDRAHKAQPDNPYPLYAKAYLMASKGELAAAREPAAQACKLKPDSGHMRELLYDIRFALGEYADLEKELQAARKGDQISITLSVGLMELRVAAGNPAGAAALLDDLEKALLKSAPDNAKELMPALRQWLNTIEGNFAQEPEMLATADEQSKAWRRFQFALQQGKLDKAAEALASDKSLANGAQFALLGLAWLQKGDAAKSQECLTKARELYAKSSADYRPIARLLEQKSDAPVTAELEQVGLPMDEMRTLYALFAALKPAERAELLTRGEKLNASLRFPHYFLAQAIQRMKSEAP